jgi:hypothetical protein
MTYLFIWMLASLAGAAIGFSSLTDTQQVIAACAAIIVLTMVSKPT